MTTDASDLARLALLAKPTRRKIYEEVVRRGELGRDAAATAVGVSRSLAAFHLDRLAEAGFLRVEYRRLSGRTGPGAGRPAKVYRPAPADLSVTVPPRDYELVARILTEAIRARGAHPVELDRAARETGRAIGAEARRRAGPRPARTRLVRRVLSALRERGFAPFPRRDEIRLANCPFDSLASDYRDTVCTMNLALMDGVTEGAGLRHLRPVLDRRAGMCCVVFRPDARN
jgi:predicted ArsR family transcriptional regulator